MGPYADAGGWRDDVIFMRQLMERLEGRVPGIRWVKPAAIGDKHLLTWDGGRREEEKLGTLADWADQEWPQ